MGVTGGGAVPACGWPPLVELLVLFAAISSVFASVAAVSLVDMKSPLGAMPGKEGLHRCEEVVG
jgi:hypothetical protein